MNHLLLLRSNSYLWRLGHHGLLKVQLVSTNAATSSFSYPPTASIDSLQSRIWTSLDPSLSMVSIIDQWIEQGKKVQIYELREIIKQLRKYNRHNHALQIFEWMTGQGYRLSVQDVAVRLDSIGKVHGLEKVEAYFNSVSESSRGYKVYGAILNCYAKTKQLEKAEAVMQNLKDMGAVNVVNYNIMLGLYSRMGGYKKIDVLMQEMVKRGIVWDMYTFNIRLQAYVACSDIDGMEKLLTKMEADPLVKIDFHTYVVAGNGYLKSGFIDKSLELFRKSEQLISDNNSRRVFAYQCLLTSYASTGSKADVYRVWNMYKQMEKLSNGGYVSMIISLVKLDDLDSAENVWKEWYSGMNVFDIRMPNLMIGAYSKKGDWEKADAFVKKITEKGKEPNAVSWDNLATGYLLSGQITKAVESIKKSISTRKPGRLPRLNTLANCLKHLKGQGDKEAAEALLKMIKEQCQLTTLVYNRLYGCINDENLASNVSDQIEDDDRVVDESPKESALPETEANLVMSH